MQPITGYNVLEDVINRAMMDSYALFGKSLSMIKVSPHIYDTILYHAPRTVISIYSDEIRLRYFGVPVQVLSGMTGEQVIFEGPDGLVYNDITLRLLASITEKERKSRG